MTVPAAPGDLELVRAFLNTLDIEDEDDQLADPVAAAAWLQGHGLLDEEVDEPDLERLRAVRMALRRLAARRGPDGGGGAGVEGAGDAGGDARVREAVALLDAAAADAGLVPRFRPDAPPELVPTAGGVHGAVGRILAIVARALHEGTWARLKLCDNDECAWAFYDRSRNRSGRWCDMAVCGNRIKARAYRERHGDG